MRENEQKIRAVNEALAKIRKGEQGGVEALYFEVAHTLRYIALKYLKDDAEADDLVQDFWADIHIIADKFRYSKNGFAYVSKVMTRRALNRRKQLYGRAAMEINYVDYAEIDAQSFDCIEQTEDRQLVEAAFGALDDTEKIIIQETYFEDKTIRQLAHDLGMSKSTADRVKHAAIAKMKNHLECGEVGTNADENC